MNTKDVPQLESSMYVNRSSSIFSGALNELGMSEWVSQMKNEVKSESNTGRKINDSNLF